MARSPQFTDEMWSQVAPLLPVSAGRRGRPWKEHRLVVEGICWRLRTGSPWRDLPEEFGSWKTVWKRFRRWAGDGTWNQILQVVQMFDDDDGFVLAVDGTIMKAHKHAAGARKGGSAE